MDFILCGSKTPGSRNSKIGILDPHKTKAWGQRVFRLFCYLNLCKIYTTPSTKVTFTQLIKHISTVSMVSCRRIRHLNFITTALGHFYCKRSAVGVVCAGHKCVHSRGDQTYTSLVQILPRQCMHVGKTKNSACVFKCIFVVV